MKKYLFIRLKHRIAKRAFAVIIIFLCGGAIYAFAGPVGLTPQQANIMYAGRLTFQNHTSAVHARLKSYNNVSGIATTATSVFSYFTSTTPIVDDAGTASFVPANEYWGTGLSFGTPQWTPFHATNGYADISSLAVNALPRFGGTMTGTIRGGRSATFGNTTCIPWGDGEHLTHIYANSIDWGTLPAAQGGAGGNNGILKANGTGIVSTAIAGTDYLTPSGSGSGLTGISASQVGLGNVTNNLQHTAAAFTSYSGNQAPIISGALPKTGGTMTGAIRGGKPATFGNVSGVSAWFSGPAYAYGNMSTTGYFRGNGSKLTGISTALTSASNYLSSNVSIAANGTWYDGPSVTLSVGTWLIVGNVLVNYGGSAVAYGTAKLWDGTTVAASGEVTLGTSQPYSIPISSVVTITSGTPTWKISCATSGASVSAYIVASAPNNGTGNTASYINAVKIQ